MEGLNFKTLLFHAVKEKLEGTGIKKILLQFFIETDQYNVFYSQDSDRNYKADISEEDTRKLKKILINKIVNRIQAEHDKPVKSVIMQMNFNDETFEIFYDDEKGRTYKFTKF